MDILFDGYIENPSEEMQLEAIKQCEWSIRHIRNSSKETQKLAIRKVNIILIFLNIVQILLEKILKIKFY